MAAKKDSKKIYYIRVQHELVEVTAEVYYTYFRGRRQEQAQKERDAYHGLVSYNDLDTESLLGEEMIPDKDTPGLEENAIATVQADKLHEAMNALRSSERAILHELYFVGLTERELAQKTGTPQQTIHKRKQAVLVKLKELLGSFD